MAKLLPSTAHSARSARYKTKANCTKINRLYGKPLAVRCASSSFHPQRNRSGLHEAQPLTRQSSRRPQHTKLVSPAEKPKRTARSSPLARQGSCWPQLIQHVPLDAQSKRTHENQPLARQGLSPYAAHQACSARRKTEAVCTKINRLHGNALSICCTSSSFHPMQNRSGLHEAHRLHGNALAVCCTSSSFHPMQNRRGLHENQPLVRQGSCFPLHIKLVPPTAQPKRTA